MTEVKSRELRGRHAGALITRIKKKESVIPPGREKTLAAQQSGERKRLYVTSALDTTREVTRRINRLVGKKPKRRNWEVEYIWENGLREKKLNSNLLEKPPSKKSAKKTGMRVIKGS